MMLFFNLKSYFGIAKIPLCALIAFSASYGYLLHRPLLSSSFFLTVTGIFFLAMGAAVLNNIQDRNYDKNFSRTMQRPLASGLIPLWHAYVEAVLFIIPGVFLLWLATGTFQAAFLGVASVLLYNGVYTPLKQRTVYAIIPGAICGMMPPYIGWAAAGGGSLSIEIGVAVVVIGIWQVPHYWLVLMDHRNDYFKTPRFPSIVRRLSLVQLKKITLVWVVSFSCLTLLMPLVGIGDRYLISRYLLLLNALVLGVSFVWIFMIRHRPSYRFLFLHLNAALLFVMLIIGADTFL